MSGIGNGNPNAIFTRNVQIGDALMPCLALNYKLGPADAEVATVRSSRATATIDHASGADDSFLLVTITVERDDETGTATTDVTYAISGVAAASEVAWAGTATAQTAKASTLKGLIDLLNEIPGIQAFALHAPHSQSIANDDYGDLAETDISSQPALYTECLYRDIDQYKVDSDLVTYMRVGLPESRDAGSMLFLALIGTVTGATNGTIRVYKDDIRDFGAEYNATYATEIGNKQLYLDKALVNTTLTEYLLDEIDNAVTIQGPIIVEVKSDDLTACNQNIRLIQQNI